MVPMCGRSFYMAPMQDNMDHDLDIKPIAKSEAHFNKWIVNDPFYSNIHKERVILYGAA